MLSLNRKPPSTHSKLLRHSANAGSLPNAPIEQEKQLKYASLVANTIMLSNVADMAEVLSSMARDGHRVTPGLVACLSPYMREHIRRFGQYVLDMEEMPRPLNHLDGM